MENKEMAPDRRDFAAGRGGEKGTQKGMQLDFLYVHSGYPGREVPETQQNPGISEEKHKKPQNRGKNILVQMTKNVDNTY